MRPKRTGRGSIPPAMPAFSRLRWMAWKMRGIAFLLETHEPSGGAPLHSKEIWLGIGALLDDCGVELEAISLLVEEAEPDE